MKYLKTALSFADQADRLLERGLVADRAELIVRLEAVSYYRQEDFVRHFLAKYTSETDLPLWMACELMTFGCMYLLKKKINAIWIIFGLFALGILGYATGWLSVK